MNRINDRITAAQSWVDSIDPSVTPMLNLEDDVQNHVISNGEITWGHSHALCNKACECFPWCQEKLRK